MASYPDPRQLAVPEYPVAAFVGMSAISQAASAFDISCIKTQHSVRFLIGSSWRAAAQQEPSHWRNALLSRDFLTRPTLLKFARMGFCGSDACIGPPFIGEEVATVRDFSLERSR